MDDERVGGGGGGENMETVVSLKTTVPGVYFDMCAKQKTSQSSSSFFPSSSSASSSLSLFLFIFHRHWFEKTTHSKENKIEIGGKKCLLCL